MRIVYAYMGSGETVRFEVEDEWTMTFGTAAGNRGMGAHELRVYSDGKKNQRMALTNVVSFWEEAMKVQRVQIKPQEDQNALASQAGAVPALSDADEPEEENDDGAF